MFQIWGASIRRGLHTDGLIFGILRYSKNPRIRTPILAVQADLVLI